MAKPYDAATKALVDHAPADWVRLFGLPVGDNVSVMDADLATITAEADRVIHVHGEPEYLLHLEFQASYDATMGERLLRYNALLRYRYNLPVVSALVLLRPEADAPAATGRLEQAPLSGQQEPGLVFRYPILRVWQQTPEFWIAGGRATLPLAPLGDVSAEALPAVIESMTIRLESEEASEVASLWSAAYILSGLRYTAAFAANLFRGVRQMKESTTYQAILEEGVERGRIEGTQAGRRDEAMRLLVLLGTHRFGAPKTGTMLVLELAPLPELERAAERLLDRKSVV